LTIQNYSSTISENSEKTFSFYPNPNSTEGQLLFNIDADPFHLQIMNIQGQLVHEQKVKNRRLNLNGLIENGVYFIKANSYNGKLIIK